MDLNKVMTVVTAEGIPIAKEIASARNLE